MTTLSADPASCRHVQYWIGSLVAVVLWLGCCGTSDAAESGQRDFSLPAGDAATALKKFTEQSGKEVIYLIEQVRGIRTKSVNGRFTARDAIERMIADTVLRVVEDRETGALMVRRVTPSAPADTGREPRPSKPPTKV